LISAPGCLSAALVEEVLEGHTDNLAAQAINYFHGTCSPGADHSSKLITPELFDT